MHPPVSNWTAASVSIPCGTLDIAYMYVEARTVLQRRGISDWLEIGSSGLFTKTCTVETKLRTDNVPCHESLKT